MIIHIYIPNFNVGGAETVCVKVANYLSQTHDVIIYVNETSGALKLSLRTSIKVRKLFFNRSILNFFQIRRILNNNNDERFITFLTHINIIVLAASFSKKINGKVIISERNNLNNDLSMQPWLKRNIQYFDITTISRRALVDKTLIASDRLHPSGKMYKMWVDKMIPVMSKINYD